MKEGNVVAIAGIVAGIVGTLLGAGLGAYVTLRQQEAQMAYEDRTRFHDTRLQIYSKFILHAANVAMDCQNANRPDANDITRANEAAASLALIASASITRSASDIASDILKTDQDPTACPGLSQSMNNRLAMLIQSMRDEIETGRAHWTQ